MFGRKKRRDIQVLKGFLKTNTYPPCRCITYPVQLFNSMNHNCYAHIWGLDEKQLLNLKRSQIFQLGFSVNYDFDNIFGFTRIPSEKKMEKLLFKDMKAIGVDIKVSNEKEEVNEDEWKIALYYNDKDFHFIRQNSDKSWSGKNGFSGHYQIMEHGPRKTIHTATGNVYHLIKIYKLNISSLKQETAKNKKVIDKVKEKLNVVPLKEISIGGK
ncbi:MAG: hypothetical protein IJ008_01850 [Clostridia bacterium]|nr:hypothetical protein [Clostridia bacterium]